jgi:hypothetical protein
VIVCNAPLDIKCLWRMVKTEGAELNRIFDIGIRFTEFLQKLADKSFGMVF